MPDRLYLSLWLRGFSSVNMLRHFEQALRIFPFSKLSKTESTLRIYALEYREPPEFEEPFPQPLDPAAVIERAKCFLNADSCYELETAWDLWRWDPGERTGDKPENAWQLAPGKLTIACFGPEFDRNSDEHLRIDFGVESTFLPVPASPEGMAMIRANVQSLLRLVHDLEEKLSVERRLLWSESGENFAEKLRESLQSLEIQ
jgi:hypothetical protein